MAPIRRKNRSVQCSLTPPASPMSDAGMSSCSAGGSGEKSAAPPSLPGIANVKKSELVKLLTCPLCTKLVHEPTAISICLHTFCRKCIYDKLDDKEEDSICPVCDIFLGNNPLEKLRPDNNLKVIMEAAFLYKK